MLTDLLKNSNYKVAGICLVGLMLLFLFNRVSAVDSPFSDAMTFYTSDTKAMITDTELMKIADVELKNAVSKSGGKLYLQDCSLFTCSLYVDFTPVDDYTISAKGFDGGVKGNALVSYEDAYLYKSEVVERTRLLYKQVSSIVEVCTTDNATLKITCKNETKITTTENGVETYEETIYSYEKVREGEVLHAGEQYRFRYDYARDRTNAVADLIPTVAGQEITGWAWWDSDWKYKVCRNITLTTNITLFSDVNLNENHTNGSDIRVVWENDSTELSFWREDNWAYSTASGQTYINATAIQGADRTNAEICIYYNATGKTDASNISKTFYFGDDFNDASIDATKWTAPTGTPVEAGGNLTLTGTANEQIRGMSYFGYSTNLVAVLRADILSLTGTTVSGIWDSASTQQATFYTLTVGKTRTYNGTDVYTSVSDYSNAYHTYTIWRNGTASTVFYKDGAIISTHTTGQSYNNLTFGGFITGTALNLAWDYVFFVDRGYNETTLGAWGGEEATSTAFAPALSYQALGPSTMYANTSGVYCAVVWTHAVNSTFTARMGLAKNTVVVPAYTQIDSSYANNTLWNYTTFNLTGSFTHGDNVTCWTNASSSNGDANTTDEHTVEVVVGNYQPTISNVQITNPLQNGSNATGTATLYDLEGDTISCVFMWYRNGTNIVNSTQSPCTNTSTLTSGNYSVSDMINFTLFANDSYDGILVNSSSSTVTVLPTFTWNNLTWTGAQYEGVNYSYVVNYTLPIGGEMDFTYLEYNSMNLSPTCTNVSTTYYCSVTGTPAPPETTNGTAEVSYWYVNYTTGGIPVAQYTTFTPTVYYGVWPTAVTSTEQVAMGSNIQVNLTYGNASGFGSVGATLSASANAGSSSGTLTCSAGTCTGYIVAPTVSTATMYNIGANYTITSSFWSTSVTRAVMLESTVYRETSSRQSTSGSITNPSNYNDTSWTTYATMVASSYFLENYSITKMANVTAWRTKDTQGTRNIAIPEDCWGATVQLKTMLSGLYFTYSCYNYTSDAFVSLGAYLRVATLYAYEENLTYMYNSSGAYSRVVPYGLTNCSSGTTMFTYYCRDEDTQGALTCDYDQMFTFTSDTGVETNYPFSGTDDVWSICVYPASLNGTVDSIEQYGATGYETRDYFLNGVTTSGMPYNETIYLGTDADTQLTYIYVKRAGVKVSGAYVYVQKHFVANDTFENVAMVKTDTSDGKGNTYLVPNTVWYRFIVEEDGVVTYTSETQHVACAPSSPYCTVTLNVESSAVEFWNYQNGITSACSFANATKIISCTFTVNSGASKTFEFYVYNFTSGQALLYNNNLTTASGTLFYDLGNENTTGRYSYYLRVDDTILNSGTVNMATVVGWGEDAPIFALLIILTLAFCFSLAGPSMMVIGAYLGLVISWLFEFIDLGSADLYVIGGMGVVTAVLVYAFKR